MTDRKAHGDTERARASDRRRLAGAAERQRRDRHQMISAETVEESQNESGRDEQHVIEFYQVPVPPYLSATVQTSGTVFGG